MKLFKISFISIISIFFFHSQLYGINLRCDFKQILFKNESYKEFNGVRCGWGSRKLICDVKKSGEFHEWISEVIIKNKDVVIMNELSDFERDRLTNKEKRKRREEDKERILKVESEVHQKTLDFDGNRKLTDRYIFVINETKENVVTKKNNETTVTISMIRGFYTLYFDNLSKKSILTDYWNVRNSDKVRNWTKSYYGECEIE